MDHIVESGVPMGSNCLPPESMKNIVSAGQKYIKMDQRWFPYDLKKTAKSNLRLKLGLLVL